MAAILNGLLPSRKKDHSAQDRILNTRWGDSAISAPIHGGWSSSVSTSTQSHQSPELDQDLPPTPPQVHDEEDGVFILRNGDGQDESEDEYVAADRENITITIPLPWKKKKATSHNRKSSLTGVLNPRFAAQRRMDSMPPPLATAEAAAIPLPESRISSPVGRNVTTSPILSFRSRLASPNLGDILSPVAEGFAKEGPSSRPSPVPTSLQFVQAVPLDRPPTAGSTRSNLSRRQSLNSHSGDGLGSGSMGSQATTDEQSLELSRPPSRGLATTAHMRASSRGPRANSRGPRAASIEPFARRAPSIEPVSRRATPQAVESAVTGVLDSEPVRRRAPSMEPCVRRGPSVEPGSRRAPSAGPTHNRRAVSREPRGRRRGVSIEPAPKVRFLSEAPRPTYRPDSFSSNDGSLETESDNDGSSESESFGQASRFNTRRPQRRRSIASPMSSPTAASFGISQPSKPSPPPVLNTTFDSIAARAGIVHPKPPPPVSQRTAPRNRSQSHTRGLYADMHDDFRLLGRDVHIVNISSTQVTSPATAVAPSPVITQAPPSVLSSNSILQRTPSPALSSHPTSPPLGSTTAVATRTEPERTGYASDSSLTGLPSVSNHLHKHQHIHIHTNTINNILERPTDTDGSKAMLAALAHERRDQLRREERERAREKVARKLEKEREKMLVLASNTFSDCESVASGTISGNEKTRRAYGGYDSDATTGSIGRARGGSIGGNGNKLLVPSGEEMWG
ncbi:hypothetical protein PMZ80_011070 [Knufia obscura]|uniref:Uncharacterized protein n=1 Tax=Knufia obscura TaxID=1635080 RepID=A0ABR0R973_9EURO|nr:hypothetical protein PMZ80_011070 [Knufia obscura]